MKTLDCVISGVAVKFDAEFFAYDVKSGKRTRRLSCFSDAFDAELVEIRHGKEVALCVEHGGDPIATTAGAMDVYKTHRGLEFWAYPDDSPIGRAAVEGIRSGRFTGCSFAASFTTRRSGDSDIIESVRDLIEVSISSHPACEWTSVRIWTPSEWRTEWRRRVDESHRRLMQQFFSRRKSNGH